MARRFFDFYNIIMILLIFKQEPHEKDITLLVAYSEKGSVVFSLFILRWMNITEYWLSTARGISLQVKIQWNNTTLLSTEVFFP